MRRAVVARPRATLLAAALAAGVAAGCGGASPEDRGATAGAPGADVPEDASAAAPVPAGPEPVADAPPVEFVGADAGDGRRAMRFADGQVSLNDHCPVRKRALNLRLPPVYVNGAPIGFC